MNDINAKSVVDSLMENLTLDSGTQVVVDEKSFLAEISEQRDNNSAKDYRWEGVQWKVDRNSRLPLLKACCGFLWSCIMGLVFLFYCTCEKTLWLFTRKKFNLRTSIRFNTVICSGFIIIFATLFIYMMVFLIKDVILYPMSSSSNTNGTLCMSQPCCIDHYIRLMGSDECWTDTGIRVGKGDKVNIVYSGAFYGDLNDYVSAARDNRKLKYATSSYTNIEESAKSGSSSRYCMYGSANEEDAVFGTLLYQIKGETESPLYRNDATGTDKDIFQINRIDRVQNPIANAIATLSKKAEDSNNSIEFKAKRSGVLCFAVNDIYVHDDEEFIKSLKAEGFLADKSEGKNDTALTARDSVYLQNRDLMFQDNLGEYLLHVTVARSSFEDHRPLFHRMITIYRWFYIDGYWKWVLLCIFIGLAADLSIGVYLRKSYKKVAEN